MNPQEIAHRHRMGQAGPGYVSRGLIGVVRLYQTATAWKPPTCRYVPSCSRYAIDAIAKRGPLVGVAKAAWRVLRCNPFSKGGYDPAD